ncbi:MAG: hemerythrin domain-containing protein [Methylotenera sp.]|uniref:hemerythrin domain-containing protein n=1 Tax=Methylotenera sp. TaxID=2051956 RepID=UPI00248A5ECA|nr:hemerythrin domain-containing protein [Methylotenera sp.]MDI1309870.1 hemerythrin domain-containing protein [Methylotenera sp.]
MQVTSKSVTSKSASQNVSRKKDANENAITLLEQDHQKVKKLFKEFEKLAKKDDDSKVDTANQICAELMVHAQIEEEIFYQEARKQINDDDLMNEAIVEHDSAKELIAQIQSLSPDDEMYDAKVTVLGEYINHHVEEEETEMFPKMRKTKVDLDDLGMRLKMLKEELTAELMDPEGNIDLEMLKQKALEAASTKH